MQHLKNTKILLIGTVILGLILTGCGPTSEVGEVKPVDFDSVDALFDAVDHQLGCPEETSGDYAFDVGEEEGLLTGRRCAESVVMAHSEHEGVISELHDRMATTQGGTLPVVHGTTWLVADVTEVAEEDADLAHPDSRDLERLATAFRASYTEL